MRFMNALQVVDILKTFIPFLNQREQNIADRECICKNICRDSFEHTVCTVCRHTGDLLTSQDIQGEICPSIETATYLNTFNMMEIGLTKLIRWICAS